MSRLSWRARLKQTLQAPANSTASPRVAVVGVGNELNGDDAVGVAVLRALQAALPQPPAHLLLLEGGLAPENFTGPLRRFAPDAVLLVDAANMGERPGSVRLVDLNLVDGMSGSTHTLPPTVLAEFLLVELHCQVLLLGIQPAQVDFDEPMTPAVRRAGWRVARELKAVLADLYA